MTRLMLVGAVAPAATTPAEAPAHARISAGDWDGLALTLTEGFDETDERALIDLARRHHHLLCHYAATEDVLPFSLGAAFSSGAAVRIHLQNRATDLKQLAFRIAGRAEYSVEIAANVSAPQMPSVAKSGRAHLKNRRALRDQRRGTAGARQAFVEALKAELDAICDAVTLRSGGENGRLARLNSLIARADVAQWLSVVRGYEPRATALHLSLSLIGPGPAFSFSKENTFG